MADSFSWPFRDLRPRGYRVILADPPWAFKTYNDVDQRKKPERHYRTLSFEALCTLPVAGLAHPEGCALALWTTGPMLHAAFEVLSNWGFDFRTAGAWAKQSRGGNGLAFGTGYLLRGAAEFFLLATRGGPRRREGREARSQRNLILAPLREHSRKPEGLHRILEALYRGPYCELFARERRPGWDAWGNEVGKFTGSSARARGSIVRALP